MIMYLPFLICIAMLVFIPGIQGDDCDEKIAGICDENVKVCPGKGLKDWSQKYGFVKVRKGAFMFYWMFLANNVKTIKEAATYPLVIWLQGGPGGGSSKIGNFFEVGPYDTDLNERNITWAKYVNLLFIDNPVGAGFSFVLNETDLTSNNAQITKDLLTFIETFYNVFPKFEKTPLYVFSESYGGKVAVEFAYELNKLIKAGKNMINLAGVALGSPWISPVDTILSYAPYLLNLGEIDEDGYEAINKMAQKAKRDVASGLFNEATYDWWDIKDIVTEKTNGIDYYFILKKMSPQKLQKNKNVKKKLTADIYNDDTMNHEIKQALGMSQHIMYGNQTYKVLDSLWTDFMKPVPDIVDKLLTETEISVVVYSGQLDLITATQGTLAWVNNLKWPNINKWKNANRNPLVVDNIIEGYLKKYEKFSFYWIKRAGHMAVAENTQAGIKILKEVTGLK